MTEVPDGVLLELNDDEFQVVLALVGATDSYECDTVTNMQTLYVTLERFNNGRSIYRAEADGRAIKIVKLEER